MQFEVTRLAAGTWMIRSIVVQMFLLEGDAGALLIDTGAGMGDLKAQVAALTSKPLTIVNTHGHMDHAGGNFQFPAVWLHPDDFENAERMCTLPVRQDYVRSRLALFAPALTQDGLDSLQPCAPYEKRPLHEGQVFELGNRPVEVICTPGHTAGSVCLLDKRYRRLFTGDTVNDGLLLQKSYACAPLSTYVKSLQKLLARRREFDTIVRCHGQPVGCHGDIEMLQTLVQGVIDGKIQGEHVVNPMRDCWNARFGRYSLNYDGPDAAL